MRVFAYKVLPQSDWNAACAEGRFAGSPVDVLDGYIHLSTRETLPETLRKYFAGQTDLCLIEFETAELGDALRWEPARGGQLFPHLYTPLRTDLARRTWRLQWDGDAGFALPEALRAG